MQKKKIIAAFLVAFVLLAPLSTLAQVFMINTGENQRTAAGSQLEGIWGTDMPVIDYEDEEYVPVGNGSWLLAVAAGLYLVVKSRKSGKSAVVMVSALALTLGMVQCRKNSIDDNENASNRTIYVSLEVHNGIDLKADINVQNGKITWNTGDQVYVVCENTLFGGTLVAEANNNIKSKLSGNITIPTGITLPANPEFTFYYIGQGVEFNDTEGATSLTFDIRDQINHNGATIDDAGEYMIGRSDAVVMEEYETGKYRPKDDPEVARSFKPLTSVLWLNTKNGFGDCVMTARGSQAMNHMEIDLSNPTPSCSHTANIVFTGSAGAKISVMPTTPDNVNENATIQFSGNTKYGSITVKNGIKAGRVYVKVLNNEANPILVPTEVTLPGAYSVSPTLQVKFAPGNLQYIGSAATPYFKFADHQWVYLGGTNGNGQFTTSQSADRDLFGWGTSGFDGKYPYSVTSTHNFYYADDFAGTNYDWGQHCEITNPMNGTVDPAGIWRTLTASEWSYLLFSRRITINSEEKVTYFFCTVGGSRGMLIVPDDWDGSVFKGTPLENIYGLVDNSITLDETSTPKWSEVEASGVLFIPAAGCRSMGTNPDYFIYTSYVGSRGSYYASTDEVVVPYIGATAVVSNAFWFATDKDVTPGNPRVRMQRYANHAVGTAVRLARNVE